MTFSRSVNACVYTAGIMETATTGYSVTSHLDAQKTFDPRSVDVFVYGSTLPGTQNRSFSPLVTC